MTIKTSMSVRPAPIDQDNVEHPTSPPLNDRRRSWDQDSNRAKWAGPWGYVITRVTNSTAYRPGWLLGKDKVDRLISEGWTISVLSKV